MGGKCTEIAIMPNSTVAEYGTYSILSDPAGIVHKIQSEIYARGPIATGVNAEPLVKYEGGLVDDTKFWHMMVNHIVSIVGWKTDPETGDVYWIVRNSWGEYWGGTSSIRASRVWLCVRVCALHLQSMCESGASHPTFFA
jgi:cathepsin X